MVGKRHLRREAKTDAIAGIVVVLVGGAVAISGYYYGLGSLANIGPGFYPFVFGTIYAVMGAALALMALGRTTDVAVQAVQPHKRSLLFISLAVGSFIALIETAGMFPALAATTFLASLSDKGARVKPAVVFSVVLALVISVLFIYGLGTSVDLIRSPF